MSEQQQPNITVVYNYPKPDPPKFNVLYLVAIPLGFALFVSVMCEVLASLVH